MHFDSAGYGTETTYLSIISDIGNSSTVCDLLQVNAILVNTNSTTISCLPVIISLCLVHNK